MAISETRLLRSALYVPVANEKALARAGSLDCDALIFDLEDSVAPEAKAAARARLASLFAGFRRDGPILVIRINPLAGEWGMDDLLAARACRPDAILLPKVDSPRDILAANDMLDEKDARPSLSLWAMIETSRAMLNIGPIAELGRDRGARLSCLVAGTNDLAAETGVRIADGRRLLVPWLMQMVLAAHAGGLDLLDGVGNDFRDLEGFARECGEAAAMGFTGKTLIHPSQIDPANVAFSPTPSEIAEAHRIVEAFAAPRNAGKGVVTLGGRMVERLHLASAEQLLARAAMIKEGRT